MDYLQLLKDKLSIPTLENSKELVGLLTSVEVELSNKTKELDKKLKQFYKAFGEDESTYPEKAKRLAEYDVLMDKLEKTNERLTDAQKENKLLARESALTKQCTSLGIDQDALKLLLSEDVEITNEGVLIDGKTKSLDKFIDSDPKLSKFKASLFTANETPKEDSTGSPEILPTGVPKGKGSDTLPAGDDLGSAFDNYLNKYWGKNKDKLKEKFGK